MARISLTTAACAPLQHVIGQSLFRGGASKWSIPVSLFFSRHIVLQGLHICVGRPNIAPVPWTKTQWHFSIGFCIITENKLCGKQKFMIMIEHHFYIFLMQWPEVKT